MINFEPEILNKLPILEVASRLGIVVNKKTTKCFIHEEKSPSLKFNTSKNYWKCFGCNAGGSVIDLVSNYYNWSFSEACLWLANEFGIIPRSSFKPLKKAPIIRNSSKKGKNINNKDPELYSWIINNLKLTGEGKEFLCTQRKLPEKLVEEKKIRYILNAKELFRKLVDSWGVERLLKSGVAREYINRNGEFFYGLIWWDKTILFPFFNFENQIDYIQGRSLSPTSKIRYINLYDVNTEIYNTSIFNQLQFGDKVIITEGVTDCLSSLAMGYNAVGIIGASGFKKEYSFLFKEYVPIIMPDNDSAGLLFYKKVKENLADVGKEVIKIEIDKKYKDISECYINQSDMNE
ncbi:MAG: toprim domain-containing protein [Bacteroidales bacterium]|nr:toprim domain-containing protein [Bacteroidales bacterium]